MKRVAGQKPAAASKPALSHVDAKGSARMVDVSAKADTERIAVAKGRVTMARETLALIEAGNAPKGDVLGTARTAGVMAAKKTSALIPLCHPLALTSIAVDFALDRAHPGIEIIATVKTTGKTGVEMEALTAVAVAALTIYDMAKAVDRRMRVTDVRLALKSGGKSGTLVLE
ncbi:MAG: cyclic pyranopterin monophosphate synthase MoaC [Dehalococcoidia bacterium]|nr:cyclic pyranopterin monophosphate synthase MoaC [Dehalococcoidia bacterium]